MAVKILMPALSPTMKEGKLTRWLKAEGERIKPGDVIAEIETDKATMEVECVDAGILAKILVAAPTSNVLINTAIAVVMEDGDSEQQVADCIASSAINTNLEPPKVETKNIVESPSTQIVIPNHTSRIIASPLARRIAHNSGIDLQTIKGSGPHGRIVKADLHLKQPTTANQIIPHSSMRKAIASRLQDSKQNAPHFYLTVTCVVDELLSARQRLNSIDESIKISVNDLIIKASAMALKQFPLANSQWCADGICLLPTVDVAVAVAINDGLVTPIIRDADNKGLAAISKEMKELAAMATSGRLQPDQYQGGSFTISNLGMYGIENFAAIINPPQSFILAIGCAKPGVLIKDGQMQIAQLLTITMSCDHRVIDGAIAAQLLGKIKFMLEQPMGMLI